MFTIIKKSLNKGSFIFKGGLEIYAGNVVCVKC